MGISPQVSTVTVTTAGTRAQASASSRYVVAVYVEALKTNSGVIYVGNSSVSSALYTAALSAGAGFGITADSHGRVSTTSVGPEIQLSSIWFDTSSSGDKVQVTYFERVGTA